MITLSSKMQTPITNSCNTSTSLTHTRCSPRRLRIIRATSPFWTLWSYQDLTIHYSQQFTGIPHTQTKMYTWTATTICQLNTVCSTLSHMVSTVCAITPAAPQGRGTSTRLYLGTITPHGSYKDSGPGNLKQSGKQSNLKARCNNNNTNNQNIHMVVPHTQ